MVLALVVCATVVALGVAGLVAFAVRRRVIQRVGGTFDCSFRLKMPADASTQPDLDENGQPTSAPVPVTDGKGWVLVSAGTAATPSSGSGCSRTPPARAGCCPAPRSRCSAAATRRGRRSSPCSPVPSSCAACTTAPPGARHERRRPHRLPRLAGGRPARAEGQRRVAGVPSDRWLPVPCSPYDLSVTYGRSVGCATALGPLTLYGGGVLPMTAMAHEPDLDFGLVPDLDEVLWQAWRSRTPRGLSGGDRRGVHRGVTYRTARSRPDRQPPSRCHGARSGG